MAMSLRVCGSFAFSLYSDRTIRCAKCETDADDMRGHWEIPGRSGDGGGKVLSLPVANRLEGLAKSGAADPRLADAAAHQSADK